LPPQPESIANNASEIIAVKVRRKRPENNEVLLGLGEFIGGIRSKGLRAKRTGQRAVGQERSIRLQVV